MTSRPSQSCVPVPGAGPAGGARARDVAHERPVPGHDLPPPLTPAPASDREARSAMLAYLGVPFTLCLLPVVIYLASLRGRDFARWHAAQALNASLTAILYIVCCLIVGGLLALDSVPVGTLTAVPLLAVLWVSMLAALLRAANAASHGELRPIPRWLRLY